MPSLPICLYTATVFALTAKALPPSDIWYVSINEAPAPPPGEGPPLQASALRNLAWLPAQIGAIVAAYVLSVLVIGSALLFVGRRLRRSAQQSQKTLAMEMMRPLKKLQQNIPQAFDPSPITPMTGPSPHSAIGMKKGWPSPITSRSRRGSDGWGSVNKGHTRNQPSVQSSVVTFDESVIESDMERNQREMERLYAAVMDHEEKRTVSQVDVGLAQQPQSPRGGPPELQHLRNKSQVSEAPSRSGTVSPGQGLPKSPRSSRKPTPLSLHSRNSSRSSIGSFSKRAGLRGLPISPPMGSPGLVPDQAYDESEPLSPRVYVDPGPPPPTPPQAKAFNHPSDRLSPLSARFPENRFPESSRAARASVPASPAVETIPEQYQAHIPQPVAAFDRSAMASRDSNRTKRTPAPLTLRTKVLNDSVHQQHSHPNPLRTAPLPLRDPQAFPTNLNAAESVIKATVLERPSKSQAMFSARTPRTGVPMTPYSPYMPFTPLTPITPSRLVTREERKRKEKQEGRRVLTADDAVVEEADAWGDV